jgi:hypothetical protein
MIVMKLMRVASKHSRPMDANWSCSNIHAPRATALVRPQNFQAAHGMYRNPLNAIQIVRVQAQLIDPLKTTGSDSTYTD